MASFVFLPLSQAGATSAVVVNVVPGAIAIAGATATVRATDSKRVAVVSGAIEAVGNTATVRATDQKTVTVVPGGIELAGNEADVSATENVNVAVVPGVVEIVGAVATVQAGDAIVVDVVPGALEIAGSTATVTVAQNVTVAVVPGALELEGATATVAATAARFIGVVPASIELRGNQAHVVVSGAIPIPVPPADPGIVFGFQAPPLPFGSVDDLAEFGKYAIYRGIDPLNLGAHEGTHLLLVASPFDRTKVLEFATPPMPLGEAGDGTGLRFTMKGGAVTVYPASTLSRSTLPADTPAHTWVPGKLGALSFNIDLFDGADPLTTGKAAAGVLNITDPEGELDSLLDLAWDGAPITLRRGSDDTLFSSWPVVANLTAAGLLSNLRTKELDLRDLGWQLATAELHGQRYGGTGGADGDATVTVGTMKPYAAGYVFNVTPARVNAVLLIFQVSYSSVRAITAVRDGGIALTHGADYPSWEALAAATVAPATYATCLALGLFRLGSSPQKDVTADVEGDNDTIDGQAFPRTRGQIARRIATRLGTVMLDEGSQFDFAALAAFESKQPAPVGWYWSDAISKADALNEVMRGCLGWWFVRLNGQFALGLVEDPASGSPDFTLAYPAPGSGEARLGEPQLIVQLPPRRATFIGFQKNYTPQQASALGLGLTQTEVANYGSVSLYAAAVDGWTANSYPTSQVVTVDGGYRDAADAATEAFRQQKLWSVPRGLWSLPAAIDPLADVVGRKGRVSNLNRLGWGAQKSLFCSGIDAPDSPVKTLKFWG
jgi:hypothetical protein